jgi:hypothetical protein
MWILWIQKKADSRGIKFHPYLTDCDHKSTSGVSGYQIRSGIAPAAKLLDGAQNISRQGHFSPIAQQFFRKTSQPPHGSG